MSGGGYIKIKDGNIYIHAPGTVEQKAAVHSMLEPASMDYPLPYTPKTEGNYNLRYHFVDDSEVPYADTEYIAIFEDGKSKYGKTDAQGYTEVFYTEESENITIDLLINNSYSDFEEEGAL